MRKSLSLLIATIAVAGSVATAAPAHAGACPLDNENVPQTTAGKVVCVAVITVAETVCLALPSACS
jgi:hypothetical protein